MKRAFFLFGILAATSLQALEEQPWFSDVYEFHFTGRYSYSRFNSFQNARPPFHKLFQAHVGYFGLDFSPSPVWNIDGDIQFADTTQMGFNFRTAAIQGRYLWLDDITGDPLSLTTGISLRGTTSHALHDISCPSHGLFDLELNFSLGKEVAQSDTWAFRAWGFGAVGQANRGSPWVRGIACLESNVRDTHRWALFASGVNGYGRHLHVDVNRFFGYAKVRERVIDLGLRYGYHMGVWGTLRLEYIRRVLAKSAPERVNTFSISYLLPFSF